MRRSGLTLRPGHSIRRGKFRLATPALPRALTRRTDGLPRPLFRLFDRSSGKALSDPCSGQTVSGFLLLYSCMEELDCYNPTSTKKPRYLPSLFGSILSFPRGRLGAFKQDVQGAALSLPSSIGIRSVSQSASRQHPIVSRLDSGRSLRDDVLWFWNSKGSISTLAFHDKQTIIYIVLGGPS